MTTYAHTCEGFDGVVVTTGNAPGGSTNFTFATKGTSGQLEFDTARAMHLSSSILVSSPVSGTAEQSYVYWTIATTKSVCSRAYVYFTSLPTSNMHLMSLNSGSVVRQAQVTIATDGTLILQDSASFVTGMTLNINTWYRIELSANSQGTPALAAYVYQGDSMSATVLTYPSPVFSADMTSAYFGKFQNAGTWGPLWLDSLKVVTDSASLIGPEGVPTLSFTSASGTGWTAVGAASIVSSVSDGLDSTYTQTTANPSALTLDLTLPPLQPPVSDLIVQLRARRDTATIGQIAATLRDGAALVSTATTVTLADSLATYSVIFPWAQISGVSAAKWQAGTLTVRLSATAS